MKNTIIIVSLAILALSLGSRGGDEPLVLTVGSVGVGLRVVTQAGDQVLSVGANDGHGWITAGDVDEMFNQVRFYVQDSAKEIVARAPNGTVLMGGYSTYLQVDELNDRIVVNGPLVMQSPDGNWWTMTISNRGSLVIQEYSGQIP